MKKQIKKTRKKGQDNSKVSSLGAGRMVMETELNEGEQK